MRQAVKEKDLERLKEMTFYCATNDCLREYILRYFGEKAPNFCGNCSNCNTNFETVDITVEAQKIISCVYRVAQWHRSYGKKMTVDILRGSKNEKIKRLKLDQISTYGIMSDIALHRVRNIMDFLILNGHLLLTNDEYPVIRLTQRSQEIIQGRKTVSMKLPKEIKPDKPKEAYDTQNVDFDLFKVLKRTAKSACL